MPKILIRSFLESDATDVYTMLKGAEEVQIGGLTYSEKAVQGWHETRAQDVILIAETEEATVGLVASKLNDPEPGSAYIDCLVVKSECRGEGLGSSY